MYAYMQDGKQRQQLEKPERTDGDWWLHYNDDAHSYIDSNGVRYKSVTRFLEQIGEPFNAEAVAVECATQREGHYAGMTPQQIMAQWEDTAPVGTELHEAIEDFVSSNAIIAMDEQVQQFAEWSLLARSGKMRSEVILWSRALRLAGTCDLLTCNGKIILDDIKTFRKASPDRMDKAAKQLTLYALMVKEMTGHAATVGGVVLYENYYELRERCVMRFVDVKEKREQIEPALWARAYAVAGKKEEEAMSLNITSGAKQAPARVVIYGTEGVGKSTFASRFPSPVFIDTEGSTDEMDVARLEAPKDWNAVKQLLKDIYDEDAVEFKTLVVDTVDWLEKAASEFVAKSKNKKNLADIGYGKGELALAEEMKRVLDGLAMIQQKHGCHIVMTAHAWVKHFDPPDMPEGFDRYELKLTKHVAPLIREWCSMLLFANFASSARQTDSGKMKGTTGEAKRFLFTTRTDAWDAKNRCGMAPAYKFAYKEIAHHIEGGEAQTTETEGDK